MGRGARAVWALSALLVALAGLAALLPVWLPLALEPNCPESYDGYGAACARYPLSARTAWRSSLLNLTAHNAVVVLSAEPLRPEGTTPAFAAALPFTLSAVPLAGPGAADLDQMRSSRSTLWLRCPAGAPACEERRVGVLGGLRTGGVYLDVLLRPEGDASTHIAACTFKAVALSPAFALLALVLRCALSLAALVALLLQLRGWRGREGFEHRIMSWLWALLALAAAPPPRPGLGWACASSLGLWALLAGCGLFWTEGLPRLREGAPLVGWVVPVAAAGIGLAGSLLNDYAAHRDPALSLPAALGTLCASLLAAALLALFAAEGWKGRGCPRHRPALCLSAALACALAALAAAGELHGPSPRTRLQLLLLAAAHFLPLRDCLSAAAR